MTINTDIKLGVSALFFYIIGGVATFSGIGLMFFKKGQDMWGWGDGGSIGVLFLCTGLCLSILGVLMMRLFRNRGLI